MADSRYASLVGSLVATSLPGSATALDLSTCVVVTYVAAHGPAAAARLRPGDIICSVDGLSALSVFGTANYSEKMLTRSEHTYQCFRPGSELSWTFTTPDGFPLGLSTEPTAAAADSFLTENPGSDDTLLYQLWLAGEWRLLLFHASQATGFSLCGRMPSYTLAARHCRLGCGLCSGRLLSLYLPSRIGHFIASSFSQINTPALLLQGAALIELGRPKGLRLVEWYYWNYEDNSTTNYQGIARLYLAHSRLFQARPAGQGDEGLLDVPTQGREEGEALLEEAMEMLRHEPRAVRHVERLFEAFGGSPVPLLPVPSGRALPILVFPEFGHFFDASAEVPIPVALEDILGAMAPGQLHVVVLLGPYRANGPYSALLRDAAMLLRVLGPSAANLLTGCTVFTASEDPPPASAQRYWMRRESAARAEGHQVRVLRAPDPVQYTKFEGAIEEQLRKHITTSPVAGLLEADGRCHWLDDDLGDVAELESAVWDVLAMAVATRVGPREVSAPEHSTEPEGEPEAQ